MKSIALDLSSADPSLVYLDAQADARGWSTDQLLAEIEVATLDLEDPLGEVDKFNTNERLRAYQPELDRRKRIFSRPGSKAAKWAKDRTVWAQLARSVRQTVDIVDILTLVDYPPRKVGREFHGACPVCQAGDDRLVVRTGPEGRCWCRRCHWTGNVISIVRSFIPGLAGFRDAVTWLDDYANAAKEDSRAHAQPSK